MCVCVCVCECVCVCAERVYGSAKGELAEALELNFGTFFSVGKGKICNCSVNLGEENEFLNVMKGG